MPTLRTGIDLIEIHRLEQVSPEVRARFLQRVYTPYELEASGGRFESLAGRFAAKEAVAKALGCGIGPVAWREIEIRSGPRDEPVLELYGEARKIAAALGLVTWSISISHSREHAVAVAVAMGETKPGV